MIPSITSTPIVKPPLVFLLPVWGDKFIEKFFRLGLHSLLASQNLPALNQDYECCFIFLTLGKDIPNIQLQKGFKQLSSVCQVEFIDISDLILSGTYSLSLTLAYERGMRSRGHNICQTYFFFLVADYIIANGSLFKVGQLLKKGYSGVTTGNFLVTEEFFIPILQTFGKDVFEREAQLLLKLAFPVLHPLSTANLLTQSFTHAHHTNRLFWKLNEEVMIGHFYLRHMLCIKPENDRFTVGAFCDYAFISEMCPSGNVLHIQDSDDYCVVEMAPFDYLQTSIFSGKNHKHALAQHLSEWTTTTHRAHAHIPVVYHSTPLKEQHLPILQESADFISSLEKILCDVPQPIQGHFYWRSSIVSTLCWLQKEYNPCYSDSKYRNFFTTLNSPTFLPALIDEYGDRPLLSLRLHNPKKIALSSSQRQQKPTFLHPWGPSILPSFWHKDWFDDYLLTKDLTQHLARHAACLILAFAPMTDMIEKLEALKPDYPYFYQFYPLLVCRSEEELRKIFLPIKHVMIWSDFENLLNLSSAIRHIAPYLSKDTSISVYVKNPRKFSAKKFLQRLNLCLADLAHIQLVSDKVHTSYSVSQALFRGLSNRFMHRSLSSYPSIYKRTLYRFIHQSIKVACAVGNLLSLAGVQSKKKKTSAILLFKFQSTKKHD
ncbi:MAG: hypothetical protein JSS62_06320 [Verrucomicrobia bacterium]|nr:hypothetical protein [Verrucomicrobiota bacterium]MBS0645011.1 hypothetical protein [Verrucomicrobiota bacterium]